MLLLPLVSKVSWIDFVQQKREGLNGLTKDLWPCFNIPNTGASLSCMKRYQLHLMN